MIELQNTTIGTSDRPDIAKTLGHKHITFKEVKDSFFKFLYLADIPFKNGTKLYIVKEFEDKNEGTVYNINAAYYTATCQLEGITVGGKPVYIILLNSNYADLEFRQRNKIKTIKNSHNLIVFDKKDWESFNLDDPDRSFLRPLTKLLLKRWSKSLFERIVELNSIVKSTFTLNDVYSNIESNTAKDQDKEQINYLSIKNKFLENQLRLSLFSKTFDVTKDHYPIIESLTALNDHDAEYIESAIKHTIKSTRSLKKRLTDLLVIPDQFDKVILPKAFSTLKDCEFKRLSKNIFEVSNPKTFQRFTLALLTSDKSLDLDNTALSKLTSPLIFGIKIKPNRNISTFITLKSLKNSENKLSCSFHVKKLLFNYEAGIDKEYSLCLSTPEKKK